MIRAMNGININQYANHPEAALAVVCDYVNAGAPWASMTLFADK